MTGFMLRHKWTIIALWLSFLAASIVTLTLRLTSEGSIIDNSVGIWFRKDDPDLKVYEDFNEQFGQKEWSIVLLKTDSVFDPVFLRDLSQISERLERVKHVTKVVSITNVRDSEGTEDGALAYKRLYPATSEDMLLSAPEIEAFKEQLYRNPIFEKAILRRSDPSTTVVLLQTDNFINAQEPYRMALVDSIKQVLGEYPRVHDYSLAGTSVINAELNRASRDDGIKFYLIATLCLVIACYAVLRNWRDLAITLVVVCVGTIPPMAALALFKIPYNMVTVMLPPILVSKAVDDAVHLINDFHAERQKLAPAPAIVKAMAGVWSPCLWSSIITGIGFLSLATSTVYPVWQMGVFAAIGIGLAWLITVTFVPGALVILWPRGRTAAHERSDGAKPAGFFVRRVVPLLSGRWRWLWAGVTLALTLSCTGIQRLEVDTDYAKFFGDEMYVTRAYPEIARAGYGQSPVALMVRFPEGSTYASGDHFARLLRFEEQLRKDPAVIKLMTFTDLLERADAAFNDEAGSEGRIGKYNSAQLAQLHLLAEVGGNDDLRDFVSEDKRTLQVVALTEYMSSREIDALKERVHQAGRATLAPDVELSVTGTTALWANMDTEVGTTQMNSLFTVAGMLLILLPIIFRSIVLGAIGAFINALPLLVTFGCMGLLDIKVNIATALIGGVVVGSTVDGTVYFMSRVRYNLDLGLTWREAVDEAVLSAGDGIIMTGIIVFVGFSGLVTSQFVPVSNFGALVCLTLVVAAFMDTLMTPILLGLVRGEKVRVEMPDAAALPIEPINRQ